MLDGRGDEVSSSVLMARATPLMTMLLASLPPPVKMILRAVAPKRLASLRRASSMADLASRPSR